MQLVIVESPAKAKTIEKYLGADYRVLASYGHVRDLPPKDGSVDPDHGFAMEWENYADKAKQLKAITDRNQEGTTQWLGVWSPGKMYNVQSDFCCMISPALFERFIVPELETVCAYLDDVTYHLDGPGAITEEYGRGAIAPVGPPRKILRAHEEDAPGTRRNQSAGDGETVHKTAARSVEIKGSTSDSQLVRDERSRAGYDAITRGCRENEVVNIRALKARIVQGCSTGHDTEL